MVVQGQGDQEQQLRHELSLEKAQLRRQHERELQALKDKMTDEQVHALAQHWGMTCCPCLVTALLFLV